MRARAKVVQDNGGAVANFDEAAKRVAEATIVVGVCGILVEEFSISECAVGGDEVEVHLEFSL